MTDQERPGRTERSTSLDTGIVTTDACLVCDGKGCTECDWTGDNITRSGSSIETVRGPIKMNPECKGQAVCTNGSRCWEAGECLRPYQCGTCLRSTANSDRLCASCKVEGI